MPYPNLNFIRALSLALFHDLRSGKPTALATGLAYSTLLSMVPLLALSFSVLKGFGVHAMMESVLLELLVPLGSLAPDISRQLISFVDKVNVGVMGAAGLLTLVYAVISLMEQVETAFNRMWQVRTLRSLLVRVRDYLSVILLGPVLVFSTLGLWGSLTKLSLIQSLSTLTPVSLLASGLLVILPVLLITLAFTFTYIFMPNTTVKALPALGGAVFAGLVWQITSWLFASLVVSSGQQTAIYSIFAGLFLFMLWLHIGWVITLLGARLAYYLQYPDSVYLPEHPPRPSAHTRAQLAILILTEIDRRFTGKQAPPTQDELHQAIPVPEFLLESVLDGLKDFGLISPDAADPPRYLLCLAPDRLTLNDIHHYFWHGTAQQQQQAQQLGERLHTGDPAQNDRTLRQWQTEHTASIEAQALKR